MLNGSFSFNGSFQYKRRPIVEDDVELSLSHLDNGKLSVSGWGMNRLGLFNINGGGMKNNADGSEYKVHLCKQYIYEKGTKLWKWHSIDGGMPVLCAGEVASIDVKTRRINVFFYKDGGSEWLSKDVAIKIAHTAPPKANAYLSPIEIGYKITRHFQLNNGKTGIFFGTIISFHPESKSCTIRYDDDGYEDKIWEDVARHLLIDAESCYAQGLVIKPPVGPSFSSPDVPQPQEVIDLMNSPESPATGANANTKDRKADLIDDEVAAELKILQAELKVAEINVKIAQQEAKKAKVEHTKKGVKESVGLREPLVSLSNVRESKRIKTEDNI